MVASACQALFTGQTAVLGAKELWKIKDPNKCRFFLWLCLHGRVWTAERRRRHGLQQSDICSLCGQEVETLDHLLLQCVLSREIWFKVLRHSGWQQLAPTGMDSLVDLWLHSRKLVRKERRKTFDSIFLLVVWHIWLERNARTFLGTASSASGILCKISQAIDLWCLANILTRQLVTG